MEKYHVAKFGGTSLCDGEHFKKIKELSRNFGDYVCIVPSAPGKRYKADIKVTDMLYSLFDAIKSGSDYTEQAEKIIKRYDDIARELNVDFNVTAEMSSIIFRAKSDETADYIVSRGEYLNGKLLALYLGYDFIDAQNVIFFDESGVVMMKKTLRAIAKMAKGHAKIVIPGFYGSEPVTGNIKTFSRGGSDVTGAIAARALDAKIYENWTDVSGFYITDPRIVPYAKKIDSMDFNELRELSCMGASVLHGSTVLPLIGSDINIRVCNTNEPLAEGTIISPTVGKKNRIAGIAGKKGYTIVKIKKLALGDDSGFARRALHAFEACSIPVEHMPLSMDNLSIVTYTDALRNKRELLKNELTGVLGDISVEFGDGFSLIAAVSSLLGENADAVCTMFNALAKNNITVRLIDNGSGSDSVVAGVDDSCFETALKAIYDEFESKGFIG